MCCIYFMLLLSVYARATILVRTVCDGLLKHSSGFFSSIKPKLFTRAPPRSTLNGWGKGGGLNFRKNNEILSNNWKCPSCFVQDCLKCVEIKCIFISILIRILAKYFAYDHCLWNMAYTYVHNYIKNLK